MALASVQTCLLILTSDENDIGNRQENGRFKKEKIASFFEYLFVMLPLEFKV
jgi:hypothetical protein